MAQWERECGCLQGAITANTHTCTCMCTHRSSPWEQHHSKTPACEQSKHYSNTHAYVVPFLGSSSLAILFGGETNSSSLKGNLFMPELQWTHTQKHTVTHTNHCLNALNNQLTGYKTHTHRHKAHGHFLETTTPVCFLLRKCQRLSGFKTTKKQLWKEQKGAPVNSPLLSVFCRERLQKKQKGRN